MPPRPVELVREHAEERVEHPVDDEIVLVVPERLTREVVPECVERAVEDLEVLVPHPPEPRRPLRAVPDGRVFHIGLEAGGPEIGFGSGLLAGRRLSGQYGVVRFVGSDGFPGRVKVGTILGRGGQELEEYDYSGTDDFRLQPHPPLRCEAGARTACYSRLTHFNNNLVEIKEQLSPGAKFA